MPPEKSLWSVSSPRVTYSGRRIGPCRLAWLKQGSALVAGVILCLAGGCRNPATTIDREAQGLHVAWKQRSEAHAGRDTRVLSWTEAVDLLKARNPQLIKADEDRFRAHREIGQVYRDLLPYMQLRAGVDKRINELDTLSFDDVRWDLNAFAVLSGLLTLNRDVYAAELSYLRSNLVREITWREKVVELHRLFIATGQLQVASQRLAESERILHDIPVPRRSLESAPATVASLREQLRARQAKLDADLMNLLDLVDYRVRLADGGLPEVDYFKVPLDTADSARVGVLRRKLLAVELAGAKARLEGAKMSYWPDISVFLSSGPLWTSRDGQTVWWRSEETRFSAYAYMPIDLNGRIRNRVRDAKADLAFLEREIALKEAVLVGEFEDKGRALAQVENDMDEQERKRALLMQLIAIEGAENLGERLRQWSEIETGRENAVDQRAQLNAFFLFFDEAFWSGPSAPAGSLTEPGEPHRP